MESTRILPLLPERLPEKRKHENYVFLLGAQDAEMDEIEEILKRHKLDYLHAMAGGTRVHAGNAYQADPIQIAKNAVIVLVECEPRDLHVFSGILRRIDHHNPGDPGYGFPPEHYWKASSIGQLYTYLKKKQKPSRKHLIIAARDHCRFKVRQCPGVSLKDVSNYGRHIIAIELGVRRKVLDENIQLMQRVIKRSHSIFIGEQAVVDMRRAPEVGDVYSLGYLSLYEALADLEQAALVQTRNKGDNAVKITLMGASDPSTIKYFKDVWAPSEGLINIYGCEARGYAGGYRDKSPFLKAA